MSGILPITSTPRISSYDQVESLRARLKSRMAASTEKLVNIREVVKSESDALTKILESSHKGPEKGSEQKAGSRQADAKTSSLEDRKAGVILPA